MENYEYELPSDFEDEEIDEDAAFTEEDKKLYAGWFEGTEAALASNGRAAADDGLLDSEDDEDGDEKGYNTDDFSAEVGLRPMIVFHKSPQWYSKSHKTPCALHAACSDRCVSKHTLQCCEGVTGPAGLRCYRTGLVCVMHVTMHGFLACCVIGASVDAGGCWPGRRASGRGGR